MQALIKQLRPDNFDDIVTDPRLRFVQGDIRDLAALKLLLERLQIDTVFHAAAQPIVVGLLAAQQDACAALPYEIVGIEAPALADVYVRERLRAAGPDTEGRGRVERLAV